MDKGRREAWLRCSPAPRLRKLAFLFLAGAFGGALVGSPVLGACTVLLGWLCSNRFSLLNRSTLRHSRDVLWRYLTYQAPVSGAAGVWICSVSHGWRGGSPTRGFRGRCVAPCCSEGTGPEAKHGDTRRNDLDGARGRAPLGFTSDGERQRSEEGGAAWAKAASF
jgi:hypothetical protein